MSLKHHQSENRRCESVCVRACASSRVGTRGLRGVNRHMCWSIFVGAQGGKEQHKLRSQVEFFVDKWQTGVRYILRYDWSSEVSRR